MWNLPALALLRYTGTRPNLPTCWQFKASIHAYVSTMDAPAPWHAAYPTPRNANPDGLSPSQVLDLLQSEGPGEDFILVDLRRTDHEVSFPCPRPSQLSLWFLELDETARLLTVPMTREVQSGDPLISLPRASIPPFRSCIVLSVLPAFVQSSGTVVSHLHSLKIRQTAG